jgi:hypothetical protein
MINDAKRVELATKAQFDSEHQPGWLRPINSFDLSNRLFNANSFRPRWLAETAGTRIDVHRATKATLLQSGILEITLCFL